MDIIDRIAIHINISEIPTFPISRQDLSFPTIQDNIEKRKGEPYLIIK